MMHYAFTYLYYTKQLSKLSLDHPVKDTGPLSSIGARHRCIALILYGGRYRRCIPFLSASILAASWITTASSTQGRLNRSLLLKSSSLTLPPFVPMVPTWYPSIWSKSLAWAANQFWINTCGFALGRQSWQRIRVEGKGHTRTILENLSSASIPSQNKPIPQLYLPIERPDFLLPLRMSWRFVTFLIFVDLPFQLVYQNISNWNCNLGLRGLCMG